jgi:hypothetical protein
MTFRARRTITLSTLLILISVAAPVRAQWVVHDPGNLAQAILIAERTWREYLTLFAQYETLVRMATSLPGLARYRVPTIATTLHDAARWTFGRPWLEGLNSGDADGTAYWRTARRLDTPPDALRALPAAARRAIEQTYATIEIADSVAQLGGHQAALVRTYTAQLQRAIDALEADVTGGVAGTNELTATLDKVAAGALIARRQDMAANQLLTHALEQLLIRGKRLRDAEAAAMNMRVGHFSEGRAAARSVTRGVAADLRMWRQP